MYWERTRRPDRWGTNAAWCFDRVPSFDGEWDFDKVGSRSKLVFSFCRIILVIALLYDFRSSGNGSILWALLDCHTPFFGGWISLISYCSCNGVKLAGVTLLYLPSSSFDTPTSTPWCRSLQSLQQYCRKAVGKLFPYHLHGINWIIFFPIYKKARAKAYTIEIIKVAFKVAGIFLLNPRVVLSQFSKPTSKSRRESRTDTICILDYTPYTKYDLR